MLKNNIEKALVILIIFSVLSSIGLQFLQKNSGQIKQADEIKDIYNLHDGYIYFGRPSCPACKRFKPILNLISKERNLKFNYFNSDYFRNEKNVPENSLMMIFQKYNIDSIPHLAYIEDGEIQEIITSDTLGNKDKSKAYRNVNKMLDNIEGNHSIGLYYLSCLLLLFGVFVFQIVSYKGDKLTKKLNYLLMLSLVGSLFLFISRYMQFSKSGLDFAKDSKVSFLVSLATIIVIAGSFLINRSKINNN